MDIIYIHSDGACSGNQNQENIGGWGTILEYKNHRKEIFGGERNTTNNRMEMAALLNGLKAIKKNDQTIWVFSDSSYLINCFRNKWYENWYRNDWKTANKTPVENRDLWEKLLMLVQKHNISFYRVKGHVNLQSKHTNTDELYKKFKEWNGTGFSMDDFINITENNNRADALANLGMEEIRNKDL
ncbi:MAG: ribonuclease HI [Eubacteriales bacterium]|nr:ribonuclease HI [Eubacteriales bacterium]MDD4583433.1 ribonuclease HI [Eubacteriales bacterium]